MNNEKLNDDKVVDLITYDPKSEEYVLVLILDEDWEGSPDKMRRLQAKINNYLAFALDGEMFKKFPDSKGKRLRFQLNTFQDLDIKTTEYLNNVKRRLPDYGVTFVVRRLHRNGSIKGSF